MPLDCAISLVKLAYNFEHWDVFDLLVEPVLAHIKVCSLLQLTPFWNCHNICLLFVVVLYCVHIFGSDVPRFQNNVIVCE